MGPLCSRRSRAADDLLTPELVRDLVSLIQEAEGDEAVQVLVFKSADPDYFISHVDITQISEYRAEASKLTASRRSPSCFTT